MKQFFGIMIALVVTLGVLALVANATTYSYEERAPVVTYLHSPLTSPIGAKYVCTYAVVNGEVMALIGCVPDIEGIPE